MLDFLQRLDRRWIFLLMLLAVATPILAGITFPEAPTYYVERVFNKIEGLGPPGYVGDPPPKLSGLEPGSKVLIVVDYDPATEGELAPMARAFIRHCCQRRHKMFFMTLWETAPPLLDRYIREIVEGEFAQAGFKEGVDYLNLGFSPGREVVIISITSDLQKSFPSVRLDTLPIARGVESILDMDFVFNLSAGYPGLKEWVQYASTPHRDLPLAAGVTAVQAPQAYPYLPEQLYGLVAAIKGAAEYEAALEKYYPEYVNSGKNVAIRRMAPQLWAHLLIIALIALGNGIYFAERRRGARR